MSDNKKDILSKLSDVNLVYFEKNKNFKYVKVNECNARGAGLDSPQEMIGKSDYDLIWKDCSANIFRETDIKILLGKSKINYLEKVKLKDGVHSMLITKTALRNSQDELIGIVGSAMYVDDYVVIQKKGYFSTKEQKLYLDTLGIKRLSRRELQIFKFILHGFTDPQMASYLNISVTSIRSIIKSLKIKLQCRSKLDIICSAIKNGWTYFLTETPLPETEKK